MIKVGFLCYAFCDLVNDNQVLYLIIVVPTYRVEKQKKAINDRGCNKNYLKNTINKYYK